VPTEPLREQLERALVDRYAIEREIGAGGMATVYLAHDKKHDRRVAIKVLDPLLGAVLGAERFLSEIKVTANLQHPNLLPLFDSGDANGLLYYVMPFVDGETLRHRIDREKQMSIESAVGIAVAVTYALAYAHERGVVHRDLKPENILFQAKQPVVADFGIALAVSNAGGQRVTQTGLSVGTPQYMSPEQAVADRGVDARADIYALGAVLYEMLTGEPPHTGTSSQAIIAKLLTEEARPVSVVRRSVPPHVDAAVRRALQKLPADRFETAHDFALALQGKAEPSARPDSAAERRLRAGASERAADRIRASRVWSWTPWFISVAAALLLGWSVLRPTSVAPVARVARFVVSGIGDPALNGAPTITPDGQNLVFVNTADPARTLHVRPLGELRSRMLPGTEGAAAPFVSPDGRWVGFFAGGQVKKVALDGGTPAMTLGPGPPLARGAWSAGGAIVMRGNDRSGLTWVSESGERSTVHALTALDTSAGEGGHGAPLALPDGRTIVFTINGRSGSELAVTRLVRDDPRPAQHTRLGIQGDAVAFRDGWLIVRTPRATLEAVRFDLASGRVSGAPVAVLQDPSGIESATLADDGTLVYTRAQLSDSVVIVDSHGAARSFLATPVVQAGDARVQLEFAVASRHFMNPRVSPDGRRLQLLVVSPQGMSVWSYDMSSGTPTRLTATERVFGSEWAPDGRHILYSTNEGKTSVVWLQPLANAGVADKLFEAPGLMWGTLSPDGRTVVLQRIVDKLWTLWTLRLDDATRTAQPLFHETANASMPHLSPDGHWLAYVSSGPEREAVFVRPFPGPGLPIQVSEGSGTEPMWAPDGRRLFYRAGRALVAASVTSSAGFIVTGRTTLFSGSFDGGMPHANYAVTSDGEHFVMVSGRSSPESVVVLHWDEELRRQLARR
jgi:eukaryotic-like serine/threonine-protein kinase